MNRTVPLFTTAQCGFVIPPNIKHKSGNRIATKTYAYTLNAELGEVKSTVSALYLDPIWRDRRKDRGRYCVRLS